MKHWIPTFNKFIDVMLGVKEHFQSISTTEQRTQTAEAVQLHDAVGDV